MYIIHILILVLLRSDTMKCNQNNISTCSNIRKPRETILYENVNAEPNIEVTARLSACKTPIRVEDEAQLSTDNMNCFEKLLINLNIVNVGNKIRNKEHIVIDKVLEPIAGKRAILLNPYVLIIHQEPLYQLYGLKYERDVNAEPTEVVKNKRNADYYGCSERVSYPPCRYAINEGVRVPYSEGFCCKCESVLNQRPKYRMHHLPARRHAYTNHSKYQIKREPDYHSKSEDIYHLFGVPNQKLHRSSHMDPRYYSNHPWSRGDQNCINTSAVEVNDDSAHCLHFSDLWYSIYRLSEPVLRHTIKLKIYERRDTEECDQEWMDLTKSGPIELGTLHNNQQDKSGRVFATYSSCEDDLHFDLDTKNVRLLIPKSSANVRHPELEGGPPEYLVVDKSEIHTNGDVCDAIGVGYEAFYFQKNRCNVPRGSCLNNQPRELWRRDMEAQRQGRSTKYLLKSFAHVPENAIHSSKNGEITYLKLRYDGVLKSSVGIQIKSNDNLLVRTQPRARVTEIYSDATWDGTAYITVIAQNTGLVSHTFSVKVSDCPSTTSGSWNTLSNTAIIPPQKMHKFQLEFKGTLPENVVHCSIELRDSKDEIVAIRRVKMIKGDRCICSWHCRCTCYKSDGLQCNPLPMEQYHLAGFVGYAPPSMHQSTLEEVLFDISLYCVMLFIILLLLGVAKGLIGCCCCPLIGRWGLNVMIDYKVDPSSKNYENCCSSTESIKSSIHPLAEFVLNCFFFFSFPVVVIFKIIRSLCCPWYAYMDDDFEEKKPTKVDDTVSTNDEDSDELSDDDDKSQDDFQNNFGELKCDYIHYPKK